MHDHVGINILCDALDADVPAVHNVQSPPPAGAIPGFSFNPTAQIQRHQNEDEQAVGLTHTSQPAPAHRCRVCQRTYDRADHLSRHLKSHENARPFQCRQCSKSFNRADLLQRHVATHERHAKSASGHVMIRRTGRVDQACVSCAASKSKCDDQQPCGRCRKKGITCEARKQPPVLPLSSSGEDTAGTHSAPREGLSTVQYTTSSINTQPNGTNDRRSTFESSNQQSYSNDDSLRCYEGTASIVDSSIPSMNSLETSRRQDIVDPSLNQPALGNIGTLDSNAPRMNFEDAFHETLFFPNLSEFNQDLDFCLWDFDFEGVQLGDPAPLTKPSSDETSTTNGTSLARRERDVSRGHAAFTRSPWLWTPAEKEHVLSDQDNLALSEDALASSITPGSNNSLQSNPVSVSVAIDSVSRDRMFYLISTVNKFPRKIPMFPSLDILNHVIQVFFVRQSCQIDSWVHLPTLIVVEARPEFLLALVSAGSTVISVPAIWKMGLVLQDVVRLTVGDMWERHNCVTRELQALQAFTMSLDVGLWSGFKRRMEIAESFSQPLITMLRRGGVLGAPRDSATLIPQLDDSDALIETKWKKWAERESFKRLAIHLFIQDIRTSVALQRNPVMSFSEMTFSLPASQDLWHSRSAAEWKSKYVTLNSSTAPPIPRLLCALHELSNIEMRHGEVDIKLSCMVLLHGFWGQIWAHAQSAKFYKIGEQDQRDSVHGLWLSTQQRELYRDIESFTDKIRGITAQPAEVIMTAELFMMILHVSPDDLQLFAGKAGDEAAAQAFTILEVWAQTGQARRAAWHAGQVLRSAVDMPPADLRDFYAIAVYFASLTLWAYAHLSNPASQRPSERRQSISQQSNLSNVYANVVLDGPPTRESRAFVSSSQGVPGLTRVAPAINAAADNNGDDNFVPLNDSNSVLKIARDIYRNNFPVLEEPLPPLVENLGNLMRDLGTLPDSRFSRCPSPIVT